MAFRIGSSCKSDFSDFVLFMVDLTSLQKRGHLERD